MADGAALADAEQGIAEQDRAAIPDGRPGSTIVGEAGAALAALLGREDESTQQLLAGSP